VEVVATLLTDMPLDARAFRGLLVDVSRSSLAGAIAHDGLEATHSFGEAERDSDARDVQVRCRPANTAQRAALTELRKQGFEPATAVVFITSGDADSREDAWFLVGLYAEELRGWVVTSYLDFDEAAERMGNDEGLLHAPVGGKHKGVLIAASALRLLTG